MDRNGNICVLPEHGYLFRPRETAFSMLDVAKFSEAKTERNIWEQLVPAVHGTESGTMFFLPVHYISSICKLIIQGNCVLLFACARDRVGYLFTRLDGSRVVAAASCLC